MQIYWKICSTGKAFNNNSSMSNSSTTSSLPSSNSMSSDVDPEMQVELGTINDGVKKILRVYLNEHKLSQGKRVKMYKKLDRYDRILDKFHLNNMSPIEKKIHTENKKQIKYLKNKMCYGDNLI